MNVAHNEARGTITVPHKFWLRQTVKIKPLDGASGVIVAIHISVDGFQYSVRYFNNGKAEEVYFYGHEIEDDKTAYIDFYQETEVGK